MSTATPAAAATPPAPELTPDEEFSAAFEDSLVDPSKADEITPPAPAAAATPAAATATPDPAATPAATEVPDPAAAAETPDPAAATPAATPTVPDPKPAATSDAVAEQLRMLREELAGEEPAPAVETPAAKPLYNADELAALAEYEKDWPDISKAEELKRRKEYRELLQYAFAEVHRVYGPSIRSMQENESNGHYNEIVTAHADYDDIVDDVKAWVGEQSPARKAAFGTIVKEGTSEEIIDLIDLYKQAKGIATPAAAPAPSVPAATPAAATPAAGTPPAAKQAAQRLSVVSSKRSAATPVTADPNDYDAAFAEFAKAK